MTKLVLVCRGESTGTQENRRETDADLREGPGKKPRNECRAQGRRLHLRGSLCVRPQARIRTGPCWMRATWCGSRSTARGGSRWCIDGGCARVATNTSKSSRNAHLLDSRSTARRDLISQVSGGCYAITAVPSSRRFWTKIKFCLRRKAKWCPNNRQRSGSSPSAQC